MTADVFENQFETQPRESTIKDFLEVVFRRLWLIVGIVAVAFVITTALVLRQPALYESAAKVLVKRGEVQSIYDSNVRVLTWEEEIASQIEMIKSQIVADEAQKLLPRFISPEMARGEKILLSRINAGVVSTSNVIWVTYNSGNPAFCRAAVDAVVNAYKGYYTETRTPPEVEDFFSEEIKRLEEELDFWRGRKESVLRDWDVVELQAQRRNLLDRITQYENDLSRVILERTQKQAFIANLESLRASSDEEMAAVSSGLVESQVEQTVIAELRSKIQYLELQESELSTKYTDQNPELVRLRRQIEDARAMLSREIDAQITINRAQLAVLAEREKSLREMLSDLSREKAAYPQKEVELERINTAIDKLQKTYADVVDQHMAAKIKMASTPQWTVTILNPASEPYRKKTRDYVRLALGPLFSIVVALGVAFFVDNIDHSIKSIPEAEENLGLSVLANIPETNRD